MPNDERPPLLTPEEEITLRRVAFGESVVRALRAADLRKLRELRLIEDGKDGPQVTAAGRRHFETLPKATSLDRGHAGDDLMTSMTRLLKEARKS